MDVKTFIRDTVGVNSQNIYYALTKDLQRLAHERGWPLDVVLKLQVGMTDEGLRVQFPDEVAERVSTLEYGTQDVPPQAVLRIFYDRLPHLAEIYAAPLEHHLLSFLDMEEEE